MKKLIKMMFMLLLIAPPLYSQGEIALTNLNAYYYNPFSKILSISPIKLHNHYTLGGNTWI